MESPTSNAPISAALPTAAPRTTPRCERAWCVKLRQISRREFILRSAEFALAQFVNTLHLTREIERVCDNDQRDPILAVQLEQ